MAHRVIKFFIDRDSLKAFNAGDSFPCDDVERAAQLIHRGYIMREEPKEEPKEEPVKEPEKPKKATTTAKAKGTTKKAASKKKA